MQLFLVLQGMVNKACCDYGPLARQVKCEKKSAKEMGQHVMDGLSHHAGNLMGALSGALTGDDQKEKKMFKEAAPAGL